MFNNFFFENLAIYVIMRKNVVKLSRPQMILRRMQFAFWITKVMFIALPLRQTFIAMLVTSVLYVWVFWGDVKYENWACKHRENSRSFFDSKSAFCIVMTKQNKIFSNCKSPLIFHYVPPNLKLAIALHSAHTIFFCLSHTFLTK